MRIDEVDPVAPYLRFLRQSFDFDTLRQFLATSGAYVVFNAMHGAARPYITAVLKELGLPVKGYLLKGEPLEDFGGSKPDPNLVNSKDMLELFAVSPVDVKRLMKLADHYTETNSLAGKAVSGGTVRVHPLSHVLFPVVE